MENVFSEQLITLRQKKKLSQHALAQKIFVTRQSVSKWENGDAEPSIDKLISLAEILNVDLNYLLIGQQSTADLIMSINHLTKSFTQPVLNDVNLNIYGRDRIALLGSNGAGKSTLVKIMYNTIKADSGEIKRYINMRDDLNIMTQDDILISDLKLIEQIELSARINQVYAKTYIEQLLDQFRLRQVAHTYISKLSGGEKRRLSLVLSLMRPSKLLILDEPTVGMDLESIDLFWKHMDHVGGAVLTITHDFNQIDKYFSRVILLKDGQIKRDDRVSDIHAHNQTIEQWYRQFNRVLEAKGVES
ncbi:MAG: ATP-binding cassette domain-containing protein [Leuconostoc fallax]